MPHQRGRSALSIDMRCSVARAGVPGLHLSRAGVPGLRVKADTNLWNPDIRLVNRVNHADTDRQRQVIRVDIGDSRFVRLELAHHAHS